MDDVSVYRVKLINIDLYDASVLETRDSICTVSGSTLSFCPRSSLVAVSASPRSSLVAVSATSCV